MAGLSHRSGVVGLGLGARSPGAQPSSWLLRERCPKNGYQRLLADKIQDPGLVVTLGPLERKRTPGIRGLELVEGDGRHHARSSVRFSMHTMGSDLMHRLRQPASNNGSLLRIRAEVRWYGNCSAGLVVEGSCPSSAECET